MVWLYGLGWSGVNHQSGRICPLANIWRPIVQLGAGPRIRLRPLAGSAAGEENTAVAMLDRRARLRSTGMANHFSTLGITVQSEDAFNELIYQTATSGTVIDTPRGLYIFWAMGGGVELWAQATHERRLL